MAKVERKPKMPDPLQTEIYTYRADVELFFDRGGFDKSVEHKPFDSEDRKKLFSGNVDHIAIKAKTQDDYQKCLEAFKEPGNKIYQTFFRDQGRCIAIVKVTNPLWFEGREKGEQKVCLVEVVQPRLGKTGLGEKKLDHAEKVVGNLDEVAEILEKHGIAFERPTDNPYHNTIVVQVNEAGQEVKFTDRGIWEVIQQQLEEGVTKRIY